MRHLGGQGGGAFQRMECPDAAEGSAQMRTENSPLYWSQHCEVAGVLDKNSQ